LFRNDDWRKNMSDQEKLRQIENKIKKLVQQYNTISKKEMSK
jgi:hypothetical protein